jgi:hypothetical protein
MPTSVVSYSLPTQTCGVQLSHAVGDDAWNQLSPTNQLPFLEDRITYKARSAELNKVPLITDVVRLYTKQVSADNIIKAFLSSAKRNDR